MQQGHLVNRKSNRLGDASLRVAAARLSPKALMGFQRACSVYKLPGIQRDAVFGF